MKIGERLARLVESSGMTQAEVARAAGLAPNRLYRVLRDDPPNPGFATVAAIVRAVGGSLGSLDDPGGGFREPPEPPPDSDRPAEAHPDRETNPANPPDRDGPAKACRSVKRKKSPDREMAPTQEQPAEAPEAPDRDSFPAPAVATRAAIRRPEWVDEPTRNLLIRLRRMGKGPEAIAPQLRKAPETVRTALDWIDSEAG